MNQTRRDEYGRYIPLELMLDTYTVIHDRVSNRQVMRIRGVVALPVGAEIELTDPNVSAEVTGVRLLAGTDSFPAAICLDVKVPEEYWEAQ